MKTKTDIKTLRANVEDLAETGVRNKEQLLVAVPALVNLKNALKAAEKNIIDTKAAAERLTTICSDYARAHTDYVFEGTYSVSPIGVKTGSLLINDRTYHFVYGFKGYRRTDPAQKITQEFLAKLPQEWRKPKYDLDVTAINALKLSDEALADKGLARKPNPCWSEIG